MQDEVLRLSFRGIDYVIRLTVNETEERSSVSGAIVEGEAESPLFGFGLSEMESKFTRAINRCIEHAYVHGRP